MPVMIRPVVLVLLAFGTGAAAQPAARKLSLVETLRIDAPRANLRHINALSIGPRGQIVVSGGGRSYEQVQAFDSTGRQQLWRLATRGDEAEVRYPSRFGWHGSTLWIADPGFDHVALVDASGKVTRSVEEPSWVKPALRDRKKFPVFGALEVLAYHPDGSMLVLPRSPKALLGTPDFDDSRGHLVRINRDGTILHAVAAVPKDDHLHTVRYGRGQSRQVPIPLHPRTLWSASSDGSRVAVVTPHLRGRDSATFQVTLLGDRGDTIFSRRYPLAARRLTATARDSVLAREIRSGIGDRTPAEVRAEIAPLMPPAISPLQLLHVGRDHSVWIGLRVEPRSTRRRWLRLDGRSGALVGEITLASSERIMSADRAVLWTVDRVRDADDSETEAIVRHEIRDPR